MAISIHAPLAGSDAHHMDSAGSLGGFQSTLPSRGAAPAFLPQPCPQHHFNPRSTRGERLKRPAILASDANFNPRSPRGGATETALDTSKLSCNFNPRSPRGERPSILPTSGDHAQISIHAPREGSDEPPPPNPRRQSTISIHAPREGSDSIYSSFSSARVISIHAPREGSDLGHERGHPYQGGFQSTLPARGATWAMNEATHTKVDFNPRSPRGERRQTEVSCSSPPDFNPRSPRGERPMQRA